MATQRSIVLVFEGLASARKSSLVNAVCEAIRLKDQDALFLRMPQGEQNASSHMDDWLREEVIPAGTEPAAPFAAYIGQLAMQSNAIHKRLNPALIAGRLIVLDGWWWSIIALARANGIAASEVTALRALAFQVWRGVPITAIYHVQCGEWTQPKAPLVAEYDRVVAEEGRHALVETIEVDAEVSSVVASVMKRLSRRKYSRGAKGQKLLDYDSPQDCSPEPIHAPVCISKLAPAKCTRVLDTYWKFAVERQRVFMARARGEAANTGDPILAEYKFTNAYRASDRVSQYLIRNVIYAGDASPREVFFRTLLFKLFNRIDTWELLLGKIGEITTKTFKPKQYGEVLTEAFLSGRRIYSAAYIMPSGGAKSIYGRKHEMHLHLLGQMLEDQLPEKLLECKRLQDAFLLIRGYPTIGDFLAYQYVIDLNYGPDWNHSEMEFVVPGPGALDGIAKCFSDRGGLSEADIIRVVTEKQEQEFARLGLRFEDLWGRRLQLIDCQNLFCEVSKYARIAHPDVIGVSGRMRIKQKYQPTIDPIQYWYPPKWKINDRVMREVRWS